MAVLPEKGMSLNALQDELDLIHDRIAREGLDGNKIMVTARTVGQLRPYDTYGFAIEETEDTEQKLTGIQFLIDS